jgi:low affinity Fe/Cu permease
MFVESGVMCHEFGMVKKYWQLVINLAVLKTRDALGLETGQRLMGKLAIGVILLAGLYAYGSIDAAKDQVVTLIFIAVAIVMIFPAFFMWNLTVSPAEIDKELRCRTTELERKLDESNDVLYSVTTTPLVTVAHKKRTAVCDVQIGFNISTLKPIRYDVAHISGTINNVAMPSLTHLQLQGSLVIPNENKWFNLPSKKLRWEPQLWLGEIEFKIFFWPPTNPKKFFLEKKSYIEATSSHCRESIISESRGLNE